MTPSQAKTLQAVTRLLDEEFGERRLLILIDFGKRIDLITKIADQDDQIPRFLQDALSSHANKTGESRLDSLTDS